MHNVRSRVLLGAGAWLIGAAMATAGSLYAVGQLGNSLFAVPSKPYSAKIVNADLAREEAKRAQPLHEAAKSGHQRTVPSTRHNPNPGKHNASASHTSTPTPSSSSADGVFLSSADGGAQAVCEAGGAYLEYEIPQPGFEVDALGRGPAAVAYVSFTDSFGGILMRVTCEGGVPVKQLSMVRHDE